MNSDIEKFKQEMKEAVRDIDTLIYVLEGGIKRDKPLTVSEELSSYDSIFQNIKNAFDDLNKTAGDELIPHSEIDPEKFLRECLAPALRYPDKV